jgi:Predicted hydrolases or acyltransferases (alpha/beta hydrolase superfamily)
MWRNIMIGIGIGVAALILAAVGAAIVYTSNNLHYFDRQMSRVRRAGYQDKSADINGGRIAYLEGPNSGPALLLIHGQMVDKYNYAPALPELAKHFHVFAVDCYGHGSSSHDPGKYSNAAQGADLLAFIKTVIGEGALVSGHSSGGIISAYLAANGAGWVKGVLFEDPPFFTLSLPRAKSTWNWVDLASNAHSFLSSGESDWPLYCVGHGRLWSFFGASKEQFLDQAKRYHAAHPGEPIKWAWLPPSMNETYRAIPQYDPRFGDVFYKGGWEAGFDLEAALGSIHVPCIYEKSEAKVGADGILMGATSEVEAEKARGLLKDAAFYVDDKGHSWHWQDPADFVRRLLELSARAGR